MSIRALQVQVRWWLKRPKVPTRETWVLQPTMRGPIGRYERWACRHKEIYAVAILEARGKEK